MFFWKNKHGNEIPISEMESVHIMNTMKLIKENDFEFTERFGGSMCDEDPWYDEETCCLRDVYEAMKLELRLRKLEKRIPLY